MGIELAITSGIPIPPIRRERSKYPFRHMQVGDSFFVPAKLKNLQYTQHLVASAGQQFPKKNPGCETWKFATRQTEQDGMPGVRVWRTA